MALEVRAKVQGKPSRTFISVVAHLERKDRNMAAASFDPAYDPDAAVDSSEENEAPRGADSIRPAAAQSKGQGITKGSSKGSAGTN